jgi:hypothetical protein
MGCDSVAWDSEYYGVLAALRILNYELRIRRFFEDATADFVSRPPDDLSSLTDSLSR